MRVTDLAGFDGLPVFSRDGHQLVCPHQRKRRAQLFRGDWDDAQARKALGLKPAGVKTWVEYLADARFEGRMSGSKLEAEYTQALANEFRRLGLQPVNGSYLQKVEFTSGIELGPNNALSFGQPSCTVVGVDWVPLSFSKTGSFQEAPAGLCGLRNRGARRPQVSRPTIRMPTPM